MALQAYFPCQALRWNWRMAGLSLNAPALREAWGHDLCETRHCWKGLISRVGSALANIWRPPECLSLIWIAYHLKTEHKAIIEIHEFLSTMSYVHPLPERKFGNIFCAINSCYSFLKLLETDFLKSSYYICKKFGLYFQFDCTHSLIQSSHVPKQSFADTKQQHMKNLSFV